MTQQYRLAFMASWFSPTGISHHNLLPHIPSICLSAIIISLHLGKAPQSLNSSTQPLHHLGMYGCGKDCLILIPFRLPQISCFTLSLKYISSDSDNCPSVGRSSPTNTPIFPSSSFVLPSFEWLYIFFSAGQVLLSALSWCSSCTFVSKGVFLMYPWREMYSTSTYSSAILFSSNVVF